MTQGPLAHTAADFWQMVWEQGSVVIVMLTKLQENGYNLAHRYWPEEGSEQYHIFEVTFPLVVISCTLQWFCMDIHGNTVGVLQNQ